jgi:hypothetical protein
MFSTPPAAGSTRSAAALNALIRGFWLTHPSKRLDDAERREYHKLVAEWTVATAAEHGDIVEAA